MKNTELESRGPVSITLPQKFTDEHPIVATAMYFTPLLLPYVVKGGKYIVDKVADCYRFKVMAENGMSVAQVADDLETIPADDSFTA